MLLLLMHYGDDKTWMINELMRFRDSCHELVLSPFHPLSQVEWLNA